MANDDIRHQHFSCRLSGRSGFHADNTSARTPWEITRAGDGAGTMSERDKDPVQRPSSSSAGKRTRLNAGRIALILVGAVGVVAFILYATIVFYGLFKGS
ncbi:hypothetical protein [Rhizobium lentis]|uniref:Uncharacterized protein n=1 Tax=Rhizobium lentis TaxID=1138194 RepID=A0A7W8UN58_9HYPH|nr:hypothetical protein [Rhizobium lentis]MBB4574884.1 hypothetical protein [Rhizobium lentis]MBB5550811.1 hypothetical protein [Rhizobium lentis]MBB5561067.1 hypothetical protein [Rhizobium lentis]MBB5567930.1 hypothetical protein [Rhizobium lentis]